jgi:hypothetical protein
MSSLDTPISDSAIPDAGNRRDTSTWARWDEWMESVGERLNPILVKEARQALKSRQFGMTFSLLLIFVWGWSLLGVSYKMPHIYYSAQGSYMLAGYAVLLGVPLLLVVPFNAFRSLANEREDGTFELVTISTLTSRQIITGKLGSAVLQMLIYFSATSPCMAFTYMLRGVDMIAILMLLYFACLSCVLLSCAALMLATVTRSQQWNILISVVVLGGLFMATAAWCAICMNDIRRGVSLADELRDLDFWLWHLSILTMAICLGVFFITAAAAQISFESDNRSTKLRIVIFVSQVLMTGWFTYFCFQSSDRVMLIYYAVTTGGLWFVFGALMVGERASLSPRVKRSLPQTFFGRMFLTWFNPGAGTGYVFATSNVFVSMFVAMAIFRALRTGNDYGFGLLVLMIYLYVVFYLGIGRIIMLVTNKYVNAGLALPFLVHALLSVIGIVIPLAIQNWWFGAADARLYSTVQFLNWAWTIQTANRGELEGFLLVPVIMGVLAFVIYQLNLLLTSIEVKSVRMATPERVVADDRELHPERFVEPKRRSSPWDDEEESSG